MNLESLSIIAPGLVAGVLVLATHVPLGREVLKRGIIFIDLAVAQMAGLGVIAAGTVGLETHGVAAQVAAFAAALAGGLLLSWTDHRFGKTQEAIIGVSFVLAATGGLLLLANDPHGGEELRDLLVGQILFADAHTLLPAVHWLPPSAVRERLLRARGFDDVLDPLGPRAFASLFPYPVNVVSRGLTLVADRKSTRLNSSHT